MEKGRSSRLKRKICTNAKTDIAKVQKILTTVPEKHIEKVHAIVLSSDSENEGQKQAVPKPPDETSAIGTEHDIRKNDNIEQKDSSLQQLRQLIYKMSSVEWVDPVSLDPFPQHTQENNCKSDVSNTAISLEERLQTTSSSFASEHLTPFPKCCGKCRKLKVCNKTAIRKKAEIDSSQSASSPTVTLTNIHVANICNKSTGLPSVYRGCDGARSSSDFGNGISEAIPDRVRNTNVATNRVEIRSAEVNNSHLLKDRNSNFYGLQSRNQHHSLFGHHSERVRQEACKSVENMSMETVNANVSSGQSTSYENVEKAEDARAKSATVSAADGSSCADIDLIDKSPSKSKHSPVFQKPESSKSQVSVNRHKQKEESLNTHLKNSARNSLQTNHTEGQSSNHAEKVNQKDVGGENRSSNRKDVPLPSCPMCQMKFDVGTQQMDVDSHLAVCLSTAGDDFSW